MKNLILIMILSAPIILQSCEGGRSEEEQEAILKEVEESLTPEYKEKNNPRDYLKSKGTHRKNLLGEWVLEGRIANRETVTTYKDIQLEVTFYSKTKSALGTEYHTVYEYFRPGKSTPYKIKTFGYKNTKSIGVSINYDSVK